MSFTDGHALLIGVGTFSHNQDWDVSHTNEDVLEIEKILQNPKFCGYPANQVHSLTESVATKANIEASFQQLAQTVQATDTAFIFLASHGSYGPNGKWHFLPHDAVGDKDMIVDPATCISEARLAELVQAIKAERVIIFLNTCHSGHAAVGTLGDSSADLPSNNPTEDGLNTLLGSGKGRIIITACGNKQKSLFMHDETLTNFGKTLSKILQGRIGSGRSGFISAFDLYTNLYIEVSEQASDLKEKYKRDYVQEPEITVQKGVGPFAVSLYRGKVGSLGGFEENPGEIEEGNTREIEPEQIKQSIENVFGDGAQQFINNGGTMTVINNQGSTTNTIGDVTGDNNQIVQGNNNTVVGRGGVNIGGNISGGGSININTGNNPRED